MNIQFLTDENGQITAVQIPVEDWNRMKERYPGIDKENHALPEWQMTLLDTRMHDIGNNSSRLRPLDDELFED